MDECAAANDQIERYQCLYFVIAMEQWVQQWLSIRHSPEGGELGEYVLHWPVLRGDFVWVRAISKYSVRSTVLWMKMGILYYTKTDLSAARVSPHLWNNISFNSKRRSFGHAAEGWLQGALKWKDGLCFQNISPIRTTKPSACL
ncbi:hypothetical protein J3E69DRAFT_366920 [Trichoderma sp. SZMC 28015]